MLRTTCRRRCLGCCCPAKEGAKHFPAGSNQNVLQFVLAQKLMVQLSAQKALQKLIPCVTDQRPPVSGTESDPLSGVRNGTHGFVAPCMIFELLRWLLQATCSCNYAARYAGSLGAGRNRGTFSAGVGLLCRHVVYPQPCTFT